ncbi:MAG: histidine phosphatase family protein [Candidatus Micrarchaeota archaeon]|nr:histidine phosphatase family protein [Candidatus Micrarchaeota archaeon]
MAGKATELWLVRHGRARGNRRHILNGSRCDVPLTAKGREQARRLARGWKLRPDVILTSPLARARNTAKHLAKKYKMGVIVVPDTTEQDCGDWSGKDMLKLIEKHPKNFFRRADGTLTHYLIAIPGGESWKGVRKRAKRFLSTVHDLYLGKRVVVFAHGVFIIACIEELTGVRPPKLWDYHLKNAQPARFRI